MTTPLLSIVPNTGGVSSNGNRLKPLLGIVDKAGVVRYSDVHWHNAREFLRLAGLRCDPIHDWEGNGFVGIIKLKDGKWLAAYWHNDSERITKRSAYCITEAGRAALTETEE